LKAVVWTRYGSPDGLQIQDVAKPSPNDNEVLIKVHATSVTAGDTEMRRLKLPLMLGLPLRLYIGLWKPTRVTILGQELAGEIVAVGKAVTRFQEGDQVFAATDFKMGAYAEYICLPEDGTITLKPVNMSYEDAAVVPTGGIEALRFLRKCGIQKGQKVLIYGASGSIGTYAVQLAKHFGAEVTGLSSTANLELVKSLGADKLIDYTSEDFTKSGDKYDIIFDTVGKSPFSDSIRSLAPNGFYVLANPGFLDMLRGLWTSRTTSKTVVFGASEEMTEYLVFLKDLIEGEKLRPVIDRRYPLEQMAEAHRYVDKGHKKGNVSITVVKMGE
jgi:NADPH:quinone reductase-like Zn-dependent oxidoreductase